MSKQNNVYGFQFEFANPAFVTGPGWRGAGAVAKNTRRNVYTLAFLRTVGIRNTIKTTMDINREIS